MHIHLGFQQEFHLEFLQEFQFQEYILKNPWKFIQKFPRKLFKVSLGFSKVEEMNQPRDENLHNKVIIVIK